jgi:predicted  nucleic acid-binding Zn-ribbon protein
MADNIENLVLEHLRHIRNDMAELRLDVTDMKSRMSATEVALGHIATAMAGQSIRIDRIDERMARIERRFDLVSA